MLQEEALADAAVHPTTTGPVGSTTATSGYRTKAPQVNVNAKATSSRLSFLCPFFTMRMFPLVSA